MAAVAPGIPEIRQYLADIKSQVLDRTTKAAQKQALLEWRDSRKYPGAMARFDGQGQDAYKFAQRSYLYRRYRKKHRPTLREIFQEGADPAGFRRPDYVYSGRFQQALAKRRPKSKRTGDSITSTLSIRGGVLNFLSKQSGWLSQNVVLVRTPAVRGPYLRTSVAGTVHSVRRHAFVKVDARVTGQHAAQSYTQEFAMRHPETDWIAKRTDTIREALIRKALFGKRGKIRKGVLDGRP